MIDLGTLGGCCSEAFAINDAGQIAGYSYLPGNNDRHAFAYVNGTMTDLGTLGGTISEGYAINASGQVVGMSYMVNNSGSPHAFLYENHLTLDLNALVVSGLNGAVLTEARGINDSGQIVATSCITALPCQMFRLDPAGQVDPPTPVTIMVVEYHNASFDHYFITPIIAEIALLDAHAPPFQDWSRTGFSFKAYANLSAPIASTPICRFFNDHFAPKSSHFYAPRGSGCEDTLALFPDWGLEDAKLFNTYLPDGTGTCPQGRLQSIGCTTPAWGARPTIDLLPASPSAKALWPEDSSRKARVSPGLQCACLRSEKASPNRHYAFRLGAIHGRISHERIGSHADRACFGAGRRCPGHGPAQAFARGPIQRPIKGPDQTGDGVTLDADCARTGLADHVVQEFRRRHRG